MDSAPCSEDDILPDRPEINSSEGTNMALKTEPSAFPLRFSKELRDFYLSHNFDLSGGSISFQCPYRYIRLNPRHDQEQTLKMLRNEVKNLRETNTSQDTRENESNENIPLTNTTAVRSVSWLETQWAFFALPANFSLSTSPCFRSGRMYGMDVSSGAGVAALLTDHYDKRMESMDKEKTATSIGDNLDGTGELRILDLCCSPGLKLLQIADSFHQKMATDSTTQTHTHKQKSVKVVGVDICKHRMDVCRSILQKYFVDSETSGRGVGNKDSPGNVGIQLYLEDGTTFGVSQPQNSSPSNTVHGSQNSNLIFDSRVAVEEMVQSGGKRKRMNKSARAREKKKLRQIATSERSSAMKETSVVPNGSESDKNEKEPQTTIGLFDYVLVDAECSTDGSFKHIKERIKESNSSKLNKDISYKEENERLTDPSKLAELVDLQRKLIASGFRLLKDGGTLVYSTCSLSDDQNEKVVRWLLESNQDAVMIPVHFPRIKNTKFVTEGSLGGTVRFFPNFVQDSESTGLLLGDGFFLAKIRKRKK